MRRAKIRTTHDSPERVARAVRPDNTDEVTTRVEGDAVVQLSSAIRPAACRRPSTTTSSTSGSQHSSQTNTHNRNHE